MVHAVLELTEDRIQLRDERVVERAALELRELFGQEAEVDLEAVVPVPGTLRSFSRSTVTSKSVLPRTLPPPSAALVNAALGPGPRPASRRPSTGYRVGRTVRRELAVSGTSEVAVGFPEGGLATNAADVTKLGCDPRVKRLVAIAVASLVGADAGRAWPDLGDDTERLWMRI